MRPATLPAAWRATAGVAPESVLFFDFDGTLAPIGDDPDAVRPVDGLVDLLDQLAGAVGRVAIVSARPVEFLRERLPVRADLDLYGLYGLEIRRAGGPTEADPEALAWVPLIAELTMLARNELPTGALVEDKHLSVALHYRTAPELAGTVQRWAADRAAEHRVKAQPGRMVVELKPPVERDKGWVVRDALGADRVAWYFGDDLSDLAAFAALAEREAADPDFLGVRVAVTNPETGAEVAAAADFTVESPAALPGVLEAGLTELRA